MHNKRIMFGDYFLLKLQVLFTVNIFGVKMENMVENVQIESQRHHHYCRMFSVKQKRSYSQPDDNQHFSTYSCEELIWKIRQKIIKYEKLYVIVSESE